MAEGVIGRSGELVELAGFIEGVPSRGRALLLEGEAGIGKTSLWFEGLRLADEHRLRVLRSRSSPSETRIAFATVGDLFAPVIDETRSLLVPVQRRALESALLLREPDPSPPEARLLGLALVSVLHALAQERPILIAIDDVQWVDPSSADVLTFMVRRLEGEPVGVLVAERGRSGPAPLELDRTFAAFRRLSVEPLSVGAIHRLLWERLALSLPRPTLIRVYEITGGNPFFALEGTACYQGTLHLEL